MKTRFCPSPTGEIHLGNARTALFCELLAHGHKGQLLLRIEDTDRERSQEQFVLQLYEDLKWLDILWQEGPNVGGDNGPYFQSKRQSVYDHYYQVLEEKGKIYPCFCSQEQLKIQRKIQRTRGMPPRYSGACRHLSKEEVQTRLQNGQEPTWRFRVEDGRFVEFADLVKGTQRFKTDDIGDFVIKRADGTAPFLYCNAIDDALMSVTHVLRGEDHLTNTPRQILLLEALDLPVPKYGHITLIMAPDGGPLSKRHGSRSIRELREEGFLSEAVINYLARLGHYYPQPHFLNHENLAKEFDVKNLGRSAARFDESQLLFWQREAVQSLPEQRILEWLNPYISEWVPSEQTMAFISAIRANVVFPSAAALWAKIIFSDEMTYSEEAKSIMAGATATYFIKALEALENFGLAIQEIFAFIKQECNISGKALFLPLRLALTGELHGPEFVKLAELMGYEKVKARLELALSSIK